MDMDPEKQGWISRFQELPLDVKTRTRLIQCVKQSSAKELSALNKTVREEMRAYQYGYGRTYGRARNKLYRAAIRLRMIGLKPIEAISLVAFGFSLRRVRDYLFIRALWERNPNLGKIGAGIWAASHLIPVGYAATKYALHRRKKKGKSRRK